MMDIVESALVFVWISKESGYVFEDSSQGIGDSQVSQALVSSASLPLKG